MTQVLDPRGLESRGPEPRAAQLLDDIHAALLRHDYSALGPLGQALEAELDQPTIQQLDARAVRGDPQPRPIAMRPRCRPPRGASAPPSAA